MIGPLIVHIVIGLILSAVGFVVSMLTSKHVKHVWLFFVVWFLHLHYGSQPSFLSCFGKKWYHSACGLFHFSG